MGLIYFNCVNYLLLSIWVKSQGGAHVPPLLYHASLSFWRLRKLEILFLHLLGYATLSLFPLFPKATMLQ